MKWARGPRASDLTHRRTPHVIGTALACGLGKEHRAGAVIVGERWGCAQIASEADGRGRFATLLQRSAYGQSVSAAGELARADSKRLPYRMKHLYVNNQLTSAFHAF
jgi:hypothetical protein